MKRALLLTLGLLVLPAITEAQMTVNVGAGVNLATLYGDDADLGPDKGSRTGFFGGATLWIPIADRLSFGPGAFYVQKGVKFSEDGAELEIQTSYFDIPLLLGFELTGADSSFGLNVFGGPSVSFEVGCDLQGSADGATASVGCDDADFTERPSTDVGAVFGAGLSFPMGERLTLGVNGGMEFGLRTLDSSDDPDDIKSRSIFFGASVGIPVGN